jgi:hypothetical protein
VLLGSEDVCENRSSPCSPNEILEDSSERERVPTIVVRVATFAREEDPTSI